jgi:hypothetical protein
MDNLIAFAGFALQWLRAFGWWKDTMTFGAVTAFAVGATFLFSDPAAERTVLVQEFIKHFLMIQGGLSMAMQASHTMAPVPKFNEYKKQV